MEITSSQVPGWLWIPIVISAALIQTVRNTAQRHLFAEAGMVAATLSRFLFGLPVVALVIVLLVYLNAIAIPAFSITYSIWIVLGAISQVGATAFLLLSMKEQSFILGVTYSKTEVIQVAIFSGLFLHELPSILGGLSILCALLGTILLTNSTSMMPRGDNSARRALLYGVACGTCFALCGVLFRAASLSLGNGISAWEAGAWNVFWSQLGQTVFMGAFLAFRYPLGLRVLVREGRSSMVAGTMGAMASFAWFTAYGLRPAADVRTLGLVEVLFGLFVSHRIMRERLAQRELIGLTLVCVGVFGTCLSL
jgi:drug/metabolite transporter (DMT)-like permease